jgi:uncharacterized protein YdhG (YjbR/CyaY superfamily)
MTMKPIKSVDEYIANTPIDVQAKLKQLRAVIWKAVPSSAERISYGMPYYDYKGRLVYFSAAKHHIGLYMPTPVIEEHKKELKHYGTSGKATLHFPLDEKLPLALITKLVKARMEKNDEATGGKKKRAG